MRSSSGGFAAAGLGRARLRRNCGSGKDTMNAGDDDDAAAVGVEGRQRRRADECWEGPMTDVS